MTLNRIKLEPQLLLWNTLQSWPKGLWFIIHGKAFNFHDWIFCYHEPFPNNRKNQRKQTIDLHLKKNFKAPFYGWGSIASKLEPLWGGSLLFTTKLQEIPGTHFINLRRMKGWVNLGATQWFWTQDPWIGNPVP